MKYSKVAPGEAKLLLQLWGGLAEVDTQYHIVWSTLHVVSLSLSSLFTMDSVCVKHLLAAQFVWIIPYLFVSASFLVDYDLRATCSHGSREHQRERERGMHVCVVADRELSGAFTVGVQTSMLHTVIITHTSALWGQSTSMCRWHLPRSQKLQWTMQSDGESWHHSWSHHPTIRMIWIQWRSQVFHHITSTQSPSFELHPKLSTTEITSEERGRKMSKG